MSVLFVLIVGIENEGLKSVGGFWVIPDGFTKVFSTGSISWCRASGGFCVDCSSFAVVCISWDIISEGFCWSCSSFAVVYIHAVKWE